MKPDRLADILAAIQPFTYLECQIDLDIAPTWRKDEGKRAELLSQYRAGELHELTVPIIATTELERPRPLPFTQRKKSSANFSRFYLPEFEAFARSFEGMPVLRNHDTSTTDKGGRIVSSSADKKGKLWRIRQELLLVKGWAIEDALDGSMEAFSIGWLPQERGWRGFVESAWCTVCDGKMFSRESGCTHWPGDVVKLGDPEKKYIVELEWRSVVGRETSEVVFPAAAGTGIEGSLRALAQLAESIPELRRSAPTQELARGAESMDPELLAAVGLPPDATRDQYVAAVTALQEANTELAEERARRAAAESDATRHRESAQAARGDRLGDLRTRAAAGGLFRPGSERADLFELIAKRSLDEAEKLLKSWEGDPEVPVSSPGLSATGSSYAMQSRGLDPDQPTRAPTPRIEGVRDGDERDKWIDGATQWLILRSGQKGVYLAWLKKEGQPARLDPGEFRGLSLVDLARMSLQRGGADHIGFAKKDLVARAFTERGAGYASTGDFPVLLENVMHKLLLASYGITPDTWSLFCAEGSVSDFRDHPRYRVGNFATLDDLNEHGEFKNQPILDGEKEDISAGTKGNIIAITRKAIINDDLGVFASLATRLGRAAGLTVEVGVYAMLAENGGLGPLMSDGLPLFDAAHDNIGVSAVLSGAALDADSTVMESQLDPNGNEILDLKPTILLVPRGLRSLANSINKSIYDLDPISGTTEQNKFMKPNSVEGMFDTIVGTTRLSGTRRYGLADPAMNPTFEVVWLDGNRQPYLEMKEGWRIDGAEYKVRLDVGFGAVDFRSAVTNAGA